MKTAHITNEAVNLEQEFNNKLSVISSLNKDGIISHQEYINISIKINYKYWNDVANLP